MPRQPVYQALGTPRNTRSKLSPSGPFDKLANQANHNWRISLSTIQRFTAFRCTGEPCSRSHRNKISESLSLLSPTIRSLSFDLPFPDRRFSLVSHQRPLKPPSSESSPSDLPEATIFGRKYYWKISPPPTVTAREPHAPPGAFW